MAQDINMTDKPVTITPPPDYAARIRSERQKRAWTQEYLAEKSGLSPRTVQRLECGESPSPETIKLLAAAFGVEAEELKDASHRTTFSTPDAKHDFRNIILMLVAVVLAEAGLFLVYGRFPPTAEPSLLNAFAIGLSVSLLYLPDLFWNVRGIVIRNGKLLISHPGWAHHYDLVKLTGISLCPQAGMGTIRVFSFTYFSALCYSRQMGYFRNFMTDVNRAVLLEFGKKKIVVSPDDPEAFIETIRDAVRSICAEREIPSPACIADFSEKGGDYSDKIRAEREHRGWTQEELADKSALSTRTLQRLEKGAPPAAETLRRLAETFGIPVAEMESVPMRRHFKSPLPENGHLRIALKTLLAIFVLYVLVSPFVFPVGKMYAILINALFWLAAINAFFFIFGYSVKEGKLFVNLGLGYGRHYDLRNLTGLEVNPNALQGALPLTWPINMASPWCHSAMLGTFRAFVTDPAHCVVMEFGKKKIVVTPDDPQSFVLAVREELKALETTEAGMEGKQPVRGSVGT